MANNEKKFVDQRCAYFNKTFGGETHVPALWNSGLNGGVLFMRLDRMREFKFEEKIVRLASSRQYKDKLEFAEQDLLNILFHNNTGDYFVYGY